MFCLGSGPCHRVSPAKVKGRNEPKGVARRRRNKTKLSSFFLTKQLAGAPNWSQISPKCQCFIPTLHRFPHGPLTMTGECVRGQREPWASFCLHTEPHDT